MRYLKATQVLPPRLLEEIQQYVDGEYLYIPRLPDNKQDWGTNTSTRKELQKRNEAILAGFRAGKTAEALAEEFYLTPKSIRRILQRMEKE